VFLSKRNLSKWDKECPLCGSLIWGKGETVIIEGAKMTVCHACAQHGVKPSKAPISSVQFKKKRPQLQKKRRGPPKMIREDIDELDIVEDFAKRIRICRESKGLNQDQFAQKLNEKPSLIRRIESGKAKPTIKLAEKIEKVYGIKLLKLASEIEAQPQSEKYLKKSDKVTLGDVAFIRKKDS